MCEPCPACRLVSSIDRIQTVFPPIPGTDAKQEMRSLERSDLELVPAFIQKMMQTAPITLLQNRLLKRHKKKKLNILLICFHKSSFNSSVMFVFVCLLWAVRLWRQSGCWRTEASQNFLTSLMYLKKNSCAYALDIDNLCGEEGAEMLCLCEIIWFSLNDRLTRAWGEIVWRCQWKSIVCRESTLSNYNYENL